MKILLTAFRGKNNISNKLLNLIDFNKFDILYIPNSFNLIDKISTDFNAYDLIIMLGQKPKIKNIYFEKQASLNNIKFNTSAHISYITKDFLLTEYTLSNNCGKYLCNYLYYKVLSKKLDKNAIFIHISNQIDEKLIQKLKICIENLSDT